MTTPQIHLVAILSLALPCIASPSRDEQRHQPATIFVNAYRSGDPTNGCRGTLLRSGTITCGQRDKHLSIIAWEFLRTSGAGDVYRVTRDITRHATSPEHSVAEEVTYRGERLILWRDDYHTISIEPPPKA